MKTTTAGPGRFVIDHTMNIVAPLVGKLADIRISAEGKLLLRFQGLLPDTTLVLAGVYILPTQQTIQMDITVDGVGIAANREGALTARVLS